MKILMVCLGNICRSPLAEGIMREKAKINGLVVSVDSCGTSAYHIGENPDSRSVANARENGIDISNLISRQFNLEDFDIFDKIYVMDTSNYNDIMQLSRSENDRAKVNLILNMAFPLSNRSVPDPYFGGETGFQEVFDLLDKACEQIVTDLIS